MGEIMKFKYFFVLILISTILFSLGTVVASENIDDASFDDALSIAAVENQDNMSSFDAESNYAPGAISDFDTDANVQPSDNKNINGDVNNQNVLNGEDAILKEDSDSSSTEGIDLIVDMELGETKPHILGFNNYSFDIPLILTISLNGGIANNVKVYNIIPEDFEYVSSNPNIGTYDSSSGIWDIGELSSSDVATLTIFTKLNKKGTFEILVNATTDSNDVDLSNNDLKCTITADSQVASNTTRTSANQGGGQYEAPPASQDDGGFVNHNVTDNTTGNSNQNVGTGQGQNNNQGSGSHSDGGTNTNEGGNSNSNVGSDTNSNNGGNSNQNGGTNTHGGNSNAGNSGSGSNSISNGLIKSFDLNVITKSTQYLGNVFKDIFDLDSSSSDKVSKGASKTVEPLYVHDYTQIPILVFALFLFALAGIIGYGKIKS